MKIKKQIKFSSVLMLVTLIMTQSSNAQSSDTNSVYRINRLTNSLIVAGSFALNYAGNQRIIGKSDVTLEELENLNRNNVPSFDRSALSLDPADRIEFQELSDVFLVSFLAAPVTLFIDKRIRKDWIDVTLLFFKTSIWTNLTYSWGPPQYIDRLRPITYYSDVPEKERTTSVNKSSFFSGHTSAGTSGVFFLAKVLNDYHPEWEGRKWYLFGGATVLSGAMGYSRYRGLKHFPSDILVGFMMGAAGGILIPEMHRIKDHKLKMSFQFFDSDFNLGMAYRF